MGIEELKGLTLHKIDRHGDEELIFTTSDGLRFRMCHHQDCCETVELKEVIGSLDDLVGSPILEAECVESERGEPKPECAESWTWTFYKLGTTKGHVTLRWLGESNGYYSEGVSFVKLVS